MGDARLICIFGALWFPSRAAHRRAVFATVSSLGPLSPIQGHKIIHIRGPPFIRRSMRHCAYLARSVFTVSMRKVLLAPFSSRRAEVYRGG